MKVPDSAVFAALVADAVKAALAQAAPAAPAALAAPSAPSAPGGPPVPPASKVSKEPGKMRRILTIIKTLPSYTTTSTDKDGKAVTRTHQVALANMEGSFEKHNPFVLDAVGVKGIPPVGTRYAMPDRYYDEWYAETVSLKVLARHAALHAIVSAAK